MVFLHIDPLYKRQIDHGVRRLRLHFNDFVPHNHRYSVFKVRQPASAGLNLDKTLPGIVRPKNT